MSRDTFGRFTDAEGEHEYSREDIAGMTRQEQLHMMLSWFRAHFEDPAERTPYISREGGYQWIWGGPHTADEELQDEFADAVDFEVIQEAVQEIERDGYEWAPVPSPEDYDEDEGVRAGETVDGDDEWPPIVATPQPEMSEEEGREDLLRRLDALEELIRPIVGQGMMGHNNPPERMEVVHPCSREEWLAVGEAVQEIRQQAQAAEPDDAEVAAASMTLGRVGRQLAGWLKTRLEKGLDAAIIACGTVWGTSVVVDLQAIVNAIGDVIQATSRWLDTFPMPF